MAVDMGERVGAKKWQRCGVRCMCVCGLLLGTSIFFSFRSGASIRSPCASLFPFPFAPFSGLRSLTHTPTTMVKQVMPGTSAAEFRRQMEGQAFTLVDFYAEWCGPCKMIAPQVDQLAMLHPHITFLKACPLPSSPFPLCAIAWSCDVDFFLGFVECCPAPLFSAAASASAGERAGGLEW